MIKFLLLNGLVLFVVIIVTTIMTMLSVKYERMWLTDIGVKIISVAFVFEFANIIVLLVYCVRDLVSVCMELL